jgi:hypothetical protein
VITPTVGRVVWFTPPDDVYQVHLHFDASFNSRQRLAAIITAVHTDTCINLVAFGETAAAGIRQYDSVPLVQDETPAPGCGYYAQWMPYQMGQAARTEAIAAQLAANQSTRGGTDVEKTAP